MILFGGYTSWRVAGVSLFYPWLVCLGHAVVGLLLLCATIAGVVRIVVRTG